MIFFHFSQKIGLRDNLHKMSKPIFWKKMRNVVCWFLPSMHGVKMHTLSNSDVGFGTYNRASARQNQQNRCAPSEDSDQTVHPPNQIRFFVVRSIGSQGPNFSSCGQRRLLSDWADAQADLSLRWAHMPLCRFCHALAHYYLSVSVITAVITWGTYKCMLPRKYGAWVSL